ncbi:MarR family transcriptional regulator [Halodesulfurarchaeum formicicum]|uniref:Phage repressor protein n=1 Tax=Halodesulfurarchaeum formicicum TaxID=1873524 RepID=A0A1J1ACV5_9EURY|nr:MarR family transcriptional regulator [Halodesulfurarchaeum formicicum]APE95409.1 phage repressor protein [Halodesulfurarchaeum formicicum]
MTNADNMILEFFEENLLALPPSVVSYHLDFSRTHIRNRMRKLESEGLLNKVHEQRGYYEITQKGLDYLAGELKAEDLEFDD